MVFASLSLWDKDTWKAKAKKDNYYAALPYEEEIELKAETQQKTAVDVNVGHFNYTEGQINILPANLQKLYKRIKHYQRMLARKRELTVS